MKKVSALFLFLFFCSRLHAVQITSVTGAFTNGSTITINLVGGGTKIVAAPYVFDNFESGVFSSRWSDTHNLVILSTGNMHQFSTKTAGLDYIGGNDQGQFTINQTTSQWTVFEQFVFDADWDWGDTVFGGGNQFLANLKNPRFGDPTGSAMNYYFQLGYPGTSSASYWSNENDPNQVNIYTGWTMDKSIRVKPHQMMAQFKDSSAIGSPDGFEKIYFDGTLYLSTTGLVTRIAGNSAFKNVHDLGWPNAWGPDGNNPQHGENHLFYDDVYADMSLVFFMICEKQGPNDYGHCEVQSPFAVSATQAKFNYNQGSFSASDLQYLIAFDADGNVSQPFDLNLKPKTVIAYR